MRRLTHVVTVPQGLHAQPAVLLATKAGEFACNVELHAGGRSCDAKDVFAVLRLNVASGQRIELTCSGADEDAAADALGELLRSEL